MKQKTTLKLFAAAFSVVGIGTVLFSGATSAVAASELKNIQTVPTSYQVPASTVTETPADYQKANYNVSMDSLNRDTPTAADLSMEEAADVGVRYLTEIFEADFEGANVFMMYESGTETFPRADWFGCVQFDAVQTPETTHWVFRVDAVTGELFQASYSEQLREDVSLGPDVFLEENCSVYTELARSYAPKCHLFNSGISEILYESQGYSGNNPEVTVKIVGENGQYGIMTFSRYNQKLLGVHTGSATAISNSAWEDVLNSLEAEDIAVLNAD